MFKQKRIIMKKTYIQPELAIELMEPEMMIAASGITLDDSGDIESIVGGEDLTDGTILSREGFEF